MKHGMSATKALQTAAVANGNGLSMTVDGYATLLVSVLSSVAMSGGTTVNFEASSDNTTWVALAGAKLGASPSAVSTATADGNFRFNVSGYRQFRARISAYSAGTTTITAMATMASGAADVGGGGGAVTVADGADVNAGTTTDAAVVTDTTGTMSGKLRGLVKWAFERMPASLGQKAKAASLPVTLASDEDILATLGATTGAKVITDANGSIQQYLRGLVTLAVSGFTTISGGNVAHDGVDSGNPLKIGGKAETTVPAAVSDADRVDAFFDELGRQIVRMKSRTGTVTSQADQATSVTLLALNELRLGASVVNESASILYLKCGATASSTSYTIALGPMGTVGSYYEVPFGYTGIIDGIWSADSTGSARITEWT